MDLILFECFQGPLHCNQHASWMHMHLFMVPVVAIFMVHENGKQQRDGTCEVCDAGCKGPSKKKILAIFGFVALTLA